MLQETNKFKIEEPNLIELKEVSFLDISVSDKLEDYKFSKDNIYLNQYREINNCSFDKIIFDEATINDSSITDVIFINCDLSRISFIDTYFYRVKFVNCKMYGTNFIDCTMNDIYIEDSLCSLINIAGVKFKNAYFSKSNFSKSTLLRCKLKNIILDDIDFNSSEINETIMKDIDLSSCNIEKLNIDLNSLRGSIITYYQAMDLIGLLGVKIKE